MTLYGIDISGNQTSTPPLAGKSFCIVKATEGLWHDPMYATHCANVRKAGIDLGAYAFNRSDIDVASQATEFAKTSGNADFWAIDVEGTYMFTPAQATLFMQTFRKVTGHKIGIYLSASPFPKYRGCGQDWNWIASYPTIAPELPYDIWQYRGSPLDLDQFAGTSADFDAKIIGRTDMFDSLLEKAEDWTPTGTGIGNGVFRATPETGAAIVSRVPLGTVVRSTAEVKTSASADNNWRVTMRGGATLYMLRRDWNPVTPGGDPIVQASYQAFVDRVADPAIETARQNGYNAGVNAVQTAANAVKPI